MTRQGHPADLGPLGAARASERPGSAARLTAAAPGAHAWSSTNSADSSRNTTSGTDASKPCFGLRRRRRAGRALVYRVPQAVRSPRSRGVLAATAASQSQATIDARATARAPARPLASVTERWTPAAAAACSARHRPPRRRPAPRRTLGVPGVAGLARLPSAARACRRLVGGVVHRLHRSRATGRPLQRRRTARARRCQRPGR